MANPIEEAEALHQKAVELSDSGQEDEAIALYIQALALDETRDTTHYNLGLKYKYRGEWEKSLRHNLRAAELDPEDQAAKWNAGIAATALRRWRDARRAWRSYGINGIEENDEPLTENYGSTPVRLNPDGNAEVVWGRRLCPARIRINNIPYPDSGFHFGDIVLNDGAPMGYRMLDEREVPVFNALELFEASGIETFVLSFELASESELAELTQDFDRSGLTYEHWTKSIRTLCRQCSEGHPHEAHDHSGGTEWISSHDFAVATKDESEVDRFLEQWDSKH